MLAALSAIAVDLWTDWRAAQHRQDEAHGAVTSERLANIAQGMDGAMLALARRHDPALKFTDLWGRPVGWTDLDVSKPPDLGIVRADPEAAREINAFRPFARLPIQPMRPFRLALDSADGARALQCLSQAVYYEAAREPELGQEAVAQVVLNRLRHPAYPKSVCGVVFQGSLRGAGCQFSFTCDGSLRYAPEPAYWRRAQAVARRALAGFVMREVGSATHYHADYVAPYWAPTLVKLRKVGAHIFYRWTGPWGEPPAFTGRYQGDEAGLTTAVLQGSDPRTQGLLAPEQQGVLEGRSFTLAVAGEVRTYDMPDPKAPGGRKTRVLGAIQPVRRQPTPTEVKTINASLAAMEAKLDAPVSAPPSGGAP